MNLPKASELTGYALRTFIIFVFIITVPVGATLVLALGWSIGVMHGTSMDPDIPAGSLVVLRQDEWKIGDDVPFVYREGGTTVIHRIVSEEEVVSNGENLTCYHTKGVARDSVDKGCLFHSDDAQRVQFVIPWVTWLWPWLEVNKTSISWVVIALLLATLYFVIWQKRMQIHPFVIEKSQ